MDDINKISDALVEFSVEGADALEGYRYLTDTPDFMDFALWSADRGLEIPAKTFPLAVEQAIAVLEEEANDIIAERMWDREYRSDVATIGGIAPR